MNKQPLIQTVVNIAKKGGKIYDKKSLKSNRLELEKIYKTIYANFVFDYLKRNNLLGSFIMYAETNFGCKLQTQLYYYINNTSIWFSKFLYLDSVSLKGADYKRWMKILDSINEEVK